MIWAIHRRWTKRKTHTMTWWLTASSPTRHAQPPERLGRDSAARIRRIDGDQQVPDGEYTLYSQNYACPECGISIEELAPRMFSFNSFRRLPGLRV